MGALTLLIKMRPNGPKMAIIACALALQWIQPSFLREATHTPGIAHVIADKLPRVYSPDGPGKVDRSIHLALAQATETPTPLRNAAWYKAYSREPASKEATW